MACSSSGSRFSFSSRTPSSALSSTRVCSRCCSTSTRLLLRSRSFLATLPARFDSLFLRRKSPASCSSSRALGILASSAWVSSAPLVACVVAASSRSGCRSERSLSSSESSSSTVVRATSRWDTSPRSSRPVSKLATPPRTSDVLACRTAVSLSNILLFTRYAKCFSWLSRMDFTCMLMSHCSMPRLVSSSLIHLFWSRRVRVLCLWTSCASWSSILSSASPSIAMASATCL
mmetsp:Transcript_79878/g.208298  ORF Transcript_79878/g.208298 Transcript_79878/m.208298 type:complete len:232 (+) Transcript_79878:304-999(+)